MLNSNPNFKGETATMNLHMFLTFEECNDKKSMYTTTLHHLGMYVNIKMDFSNDLIPVYRELTIPAIPLPPEETPKNAEGVVVTALGKLLWNEEVKLYTKIKEKLKDILSAIYTVVWGQCSKPMHAKIQSKDDFDVKDKEQDCCVVWLLQAIKSIMYTTFKGQEAYIFNATCSARKTLELYCQGDGHTLSDFHNNFKSFLVEAFEHYGGTIGADKGLIDYVENISDFDHPGIMPEKEEDLRKWIHAKEKYLLEKRETECRNKSLAAMFLRKVDQRHYGQISTITSTPEGARSTQKTWLLRTQWWISLSLRDKSHRVDLPVSLVFLHSFSPVKREQPKEKYQVRSTYQLGNRLLVLMDAFILLPSDVTAVTTWVIMETSAPKPNRRRNREIGGPNATGSATGVTMLQFY